ncbi:MAG TPA: metallophosphoesterase [Vicinamibacterales bacterium]|jgi:Icc-related predicted phosphoesterase|nr:metallophosphoesterase [Vicinamibacterales bacterium]
MIIGAVADIHGNFDALTRAMTRHPEVPYWMCVGDLASRTGAYPAPPAPLFWIKGNNEEFDRIAAWELGAPQPRHLHYIRNGTATTVGPLRVAGLGGTFAPTWFETAAADLPHARARDDKRRHFVHEEVDACMQLGAVDILMTHEAPRPFILVPGETDGRADLLVTRGKDSIDAGKRPINDVLSRLRPRLHLCGHHHRFVETVREGVRSVCIDRINRSYLLLEAATLHYQLIENGV